MATDPPVYSSSPAFATPLHPFPNNAAAARPIPPPPAFKPSVATILPILLPPPTLRPLAFRTFTKKYNLTLHSTALVSLSTFIGRHCGSSWREEGTGEKVLEEVAKLWKAETGPVIVEDGERLKTILRTLEGSMVGGRIGAAKSGAAGSLSLSRQTSFAFGNDSAVDLSDRPALERSGSSFGLSGLRMDSQGEEEEAEDEARDPRSWLKVVSAFDQPRFTYDVDKKHFLSISAKPSMFPSPSHKTRVFKERYNIIQQRLQRNPIFQAPTFSAGQNGAVAKRRGKDAAAREYYKLTPIANLLGRGGSSHTLLGMLVIAPTGTLALNDMSGSISLDLQHATPIGGSGSEAYFCPGMIVLVDGVYEEDWAGAGSSGLGNMGGVGGSIGGRFVGFEIGGPPVEKRDISLGVNLASGDQGGGFGWIDFLGQGSDRAVGARMKKIERRLIGPEAEVTASQKMIILSEVTLDQPSTLTALRRVLEEYSAAEQPPMAFILTGDFSSKAVMAGAGTGSIEYKELFNELAALLADFPSLLRHSTWIFVPGDNDPWASSFSAGASTLIPREGVPELFTNRIRRAFATAKTELGAAKKGELDGEAIWTSNPARLSLFGPAHEMLIFRDDISARFRRNAIRIGQAVQSEEPNQNPTTPPEQPHHRDADDDITMSGALPSSSAYIPENTPVPLPGPLAATPESSSLAAAKRLILSLLPQSTLSPFPQTIRPVHWDYAPSGLSLYPLPHTLILADPGEQAFAITYEGCHIVNPGRLVESGGGRRKRVGWVEYDCWGKRGMVKEAWIG